MWLAPFKFHNIVDDFHWKARFSGVPATLLQIEHFNTIMKSIRSSLFDAIRAGELDTTRELLQGNKGIDVNTIRTHHCNKTPLHVACKFAKIHIVKYLVQEANANVNAIDRDGRTPLYQQACSMRYVTGKTEHFIAIVKFLLTNGANVHIRARRASWCANTDTALHVACRCGYIQVVQQLLNHGADVNAQNNYGETPLLQACSYGCIDLIQLLLANNADRHIKSKDGWGPMSMPCHAKQSLLLKRVFESYEKLVLAVSEIDDTQQHELAHKKRKFAQQDRETVRLNPRLSQHQHALAINALLLVRKLPVHEVAYEILGFLSPCAVEKMVLPTV